MGVGILGEEVWMMKLRAEFTSAVSHIRTARGSVTVCTGLVS